MATVKPVPDGFHSVTPHLIVKGAGKAMDFYKQAFGAIERFRMPGPDGESVMHGEIQIGDSIIMIADEFPDYGCLGPTSRGGSSVTIHLYVKDANKAYEQAVKAGAIASMPLSDMFWGDRYGKVTDPFGHEWSIAQHIEDVSPQDMEKRAEKAFSEQCA